MKFTDGYWLMRPGVTARYAIEVADGRAAVWESRSVMKPMAAARNRGVSRRSRGRMYLVGPAWPQHARRRWE
jgi:hypothetical protein